MSDEKKTKNLWQKIFNDSKFSDGFVNFIRTQQKADIVKLIDEFFRMNVCKNCSHFRDVIGCVKKEPCLMKLLKKIEEMK